VIMMHSNPLVDAACGKRYDVTSSELFDEDGPCTGNRCLQ